MKKRVPQKKYKDFFNRPSFPVISATVTKNLPTETQLIQVMFQVMFLAEVNPTSRAKKKGDDTFSWLLLSHECH